MSDKFDRYREALVVETETIWPSEFDNMDEAEKGRQRQMLHADPARCAQLEYVRVHTGFCRRITVTTKDIERLKADTASFGTAKG
jgi:hypothetical protein